MKKQVPPVLIVLTFLAASVACRLPGFTSPPTTEQPQITQAIVEAEITATDDTTQIPDPAPTDGVAPSLELTPTDSNPTEEPPSTPSNAGQIAYIYNGNVWRYLIDNNQSIQVTTDGIMGDYMNTYGSLGFSPDGRYLAFNKGTVAKVMDLIDNTLIDISSYGQFFTWSGEPTQFFGVQGEFACPDIDNLDDQDQINFDILRFDLNNIANPTLLANIGGGLKIPVAISEDGHWASIVHCACYSECGPENLWYLPTANLITPPIGLYPGNIDYSPDNLQLTVSQHQMYGYSQSPLYVANIDFSVMVEIFSMPNIAPINAQWSPNGEWIAFTGVIFADDEFTDTDRCIRLIMPDGSQEFVIECGFADFITWSPNGDQLLYSQTVGTQNQFFIYDLAASSTSILPIQADPYTLMDWGRLQ